ncbi:MULTISPECIES: hypothetical protein [unclassified Sphingomonas]|uniref:hypothetical protein n=1 Tax=Sphingomonas TaxID=13687 RepID=UPI000964ED8D|nr:MULTISPECIES: hypothetical protein [unclassified Sphingomonas]MBN8811593.1 hypothetical protein [Sphingomonas sp.]OJY49834.1 MAG: hypothetical protein BGP17_17170 [Sphingomonas sp. 67-41]
MAAAAPQGRWGVLDVFDLTRQPDLIQPAYAFDLLFLTAGLSLVGIVLYVCWRRPWRMLFYLPIALAWAAGAAWMTWHDIRHTQAVRALVRSGQFASVEGCLDRFHPGLANPSEADSGLEHWSVAGQEFLYAADEVRLGYHRVEPSGGLVHADSWVRVGYVRDDMRGHNDIVRLEVRQHACPAVPDPWPK